MKQYYIYAYIRNKDSDTAVAGTPYYIGKGSNNRWHHHYSPSALSSSKNKLFANKIRKILKANINIADFIIKICVNLDQNTALTIEQNLINTIGRRLFNQGPLVNICDNGFSGPILKGASNPNTNIDGQTNQVNIKKSNSLKQTWKSGMFKRSELTLAQLKQKGEKLSVSKRSFWDSKNGELERLRRLNESKYTYLFISPTNKQYITKLKVKQFCQLYGLSYSVIRKMVKNEYKPGIYKGWKCTNLQNKENLPIDVVNFDC